MKKIFALSILLFLITCTDVGEINLTCVLWHTTEVIKMESSLLGEKEEIFVNLFWRWTYETPSGDAIIVERSIGDSTSFVVIDTMWQIDSLMNYTDNDTLLQSNSQVYYKLSFLHGKATDEFVTTDVMVPVSQHFYSPQDTVAGDTLNLAFAQLADFDNCSIAIYNTFATELESLMNFVNPIFDTSLSYPDTTITVYMPDTIFPDTSLYTIKISSSKVIELITDTSIGFRAFFKQP